MIRIVRGEAPPGFMELADELDQRWQLEAAKVSPISLTSYWQKVRPRLRTQAMVLWERQHHKCAFCESKVEHVSRYHIEHYRPKARFPGFIFQWDNWLISCGRCNEAKWSHFPDCDGLPCLVNPAAEDPALHIEFMGYTPIGLTMRGEQTIELLQLRRSPLEEERSRWLHTIQVLLLAMVRIGDEKLRDQIRRYIISAVNDDAPYASMTRAFLKSKAPKLYAAATQPTDSRLQLDPQALDELVQQLQKELLDYL